jgi:SAM-dependent methyltransferase
LKRGTPRQVSGGEAGQTTSRTKALCCLCGDTMPAPFIAVRDNRTGILDRLFHYAQCHRCGLVSIEPLPDREAAVTGHEQGYRDIVAHAELQPVRAKPRMSALINRLRYLWHVVDGMPSLDRLPIRGKVVDVGSGTGEHVAELLRLGFDAVGIEPNAQAVAVATARGVPARRGTSEDPGYPPGSFDTIILNQVIEHLVDPVGAIRTLGGLLKPGGRMIILTPNVSGWPRRAFGGEWAHWHPPYHVHLFGTRQLERALTEGGLRVESIRTLTPAYWITASVQLMRHRSRSTGWQLPAAGWQPPHLVRLALAPITRIADVLGTGDCLVAVASKRGT